MAGLISQIQQMNSKKREKEAAIQVLEANISNQKKIFQEYKDKIQVKKGESIQFVERIIQQQKLLDQKLKKLARKIEILFEAQEELAFIYETHGKKLQGTTRFLEYIKTYETKASLKALRERLNIDLPATNRPKPDPAKNLASDSAGENSKLEPLTFNGFKDILKAVLRESS